MTGIVAGTFPQSPLPPNPAHPPETTANTSIARSRPEDQFQYIVSTHVDQDFTTYLTQLYQTQEFRSHIQRYTIVGHNLRNH